MLANICFSFRDRKEKLNSLLFTVTSVHWKYTVDDEKRRKRATLNLCITTDICRKEVAKTEKESAFKTQIRKSLKHF